MSLSSNTIDRIVANVLHQLGGGSADVPKSRELPHSGKENSNPAFPSGDSAKSRSLSEKVLTAESFEAIQCNQSVTVLTNAIITPAAYDLIKERKLVIVRTSVIQGSAELGSAEQGGSKSSSKQIKIQTLNCYIVKHTESVVRVIAELGPSHKDLLSCPDDAAKAAISAICRGEAETVLIFVEQVHRAACFANRNEKVKAVVIADNGDIKEVRKQLRANVWCINPTGRSYFELRNLMKGLKVES